MPPWLQNAQKNTNTWFITGTDYLNNINALNEVMDLSTFGQTDQVGAYVNPNFELFEVDEVLQDRMDNYPPVLVPYGQPALSNPRIFSCIRKSALSTLKDPCWQFITVMTKNPLYWPDQESGSGNFRKRD